jgi:hypothetical protein
MKNETQAKQNQTRDQAKVEKRDEPVKLRLRTGLKAGAHIKQYDA